MIKPYIVFDKNNFSIKIKNILYKKLKNHSVLNSNLIIVIGGDGFMLETLKKYNIQVTTICPGYVKSEMTKVMNESHMPFLMDTDIAARKIIRAIDFGKKTYIFPWQLRYLITAMKPFPDKLLLKLLS